MYSMIVKKICRPGGSGTPQLHPDDEFEARDISMVRLATAMGWAELKEKSEPAPAEAAETEGEDDMTKAKKKAAKKVAKPVKAAKTGKYNTRNMRAR